MGVIESGFRSQVQPDSPQDTPPARNTRRIVHERRPVGFRWGIATILAALVVLSTVVLGSYQSQPVDPAAELATDPAPAPVSPQDSEQPEAGVPPVPPVVPAPPAIVTHVPTEGSGQVIVAAYTQPAPTQNGRKVRVRVEVERDMPVDAEAAATEVAAVLHDRRSWTGKQRVHFDFVGDQPHDLIVRVLTPATTDKRCLPLRTLGQVSCSQGNAVNLNGVRWVGAVPDYSGDVAGYRTYLVNHEVGHFLGYGHVSCPGPGQPAPVMMQQTKGLKGCAKNPWP